MMRMIICRLAAFLQLLVIGIAQILRRSRSTAVPMLCFPRRAGWRSA